MSPLPLYATPGSPETALVLLLHQPGQPAQLVLSPNLRLSGLLRVLPPDLLQIFVALLTFQGAMGEVRAVVESLAETLGLHPDQVQQRLQLLAAYTFDGAPLIFPSSLDASSSAEQAYSLSKRVGVPVDITPPEPATEKPYRAVPREEIVQRSRERYATPRAEAEVIVAEQLGNTPPEPIPEGREGEAYKAMLAVGVPEHEVRKLLAEFPIESIEIQLEWLPARGARNPARFLTAAIRGDYASPDTPRP
ncbi:hypothetical protein [Armatimonas sp.]|uniref:hypothetical protein n=1 Tax=Armatimonas sp. TaxID=1872638 RepID=UPI00374D2CCA